MRHTVKLADLRKPNHLQGSSLGKRDLQDQPANWGDWTPIPGSEHRKGTNVLVQHELPADVGGCSIVRVAVHPKDQAVVSAPAQTKVLVVVPPDDSGVVIVCRVPGERVNNELSGFTGEAQGTQNQRGEGAFE